MIDEIIKNFEKGSMKHKETILYSKDEHCSDSNESCNISTCYYQTKQCMHDSSVVDKEFRKFGDRLVIALRAIMLDAKTTIAANDNSNSIFETNGCFYCALSLIATRIESLSLQLSREMLILKLRLPME